MSYITLSGGSAPETPTGVKSRLFVRSTNDEYRPCVLNSAGVLSVIRGPQTNYVRNSGFWFAQRQTPSSATTYSNTSGRAISADGWGITNENASATFQRQDSAGFAFGIQGRFYGDFLKTTSTGKLVVSQVIEGNDSNALRGRTVRVQCWMVQQVASGPVIRLGLAYLSSSGTMDSIPATFISAFGSNGVDPTLGTNLSLIAPKSTVLPENGTISGNAVSCTLTSGWRRYGACFDVPSTAKNLVVMLFSNNQLAATNGFSLTQVTLTDGYEIADWLPDPYEVELGRVRRHYWKTFNVDTAPVTSIGVNTGEFRFTSPIAGATAFAGVGGRLGVPMRTAPTFTLYNPSAANAQIRNITDGADLTGSSITANGEESFHLAGTGTAGTAAGEQLGVHITAEAEL